TGFEIASNLRLKCFSNKSTTENPDTRKGDSDKLSSITIRYVIKLYEIVNNPFQDNPISVVCKALNGLKSRV
ncbi:hypothetical protein MM716_32950, partial [Klebsiella pneumoniae]|nr:hypothetical protein [Klebsiella pneumoniae]